MKETVYVETSVLSYLTVRSSNDLRAMANQNTTTEWWETRRPNYSVFASDLVISEASRGHPEASRRRLAAIADLPLLQGIGKTKILENRCVYRKLTPCQPWREAPTCSISENVRALTKALIESHALPEKAEADAYHVAIAAVNGVAYLLTWNCTHIANARTRPKIETTCRIFGYEPPVICTPLELMEP
uniref:PIN domain-containing protein n=1 Tax=Candidatus Kentrum sp. TUN TaxID=2126343 RepID=A0A450ZQ77_9GAMM|nr:MAG: hypothetical protein BECKTUN1418E_GA0071001_10351 [Candidatus Kentron sp. TUN]